MTAEVDHNGPVWRHSRPRALPWLALLLLTLCAPGLWADLWYEHYEKGEDALRTQNWPQAVDELTAAVAKRPIPGQRARIYGMKWVSYNPYYKLGIAYLNLGQYDAAVKAFDTELEMGIILESASDLANLKELRARAQEELTAIAKAQQEELDGKAARALEASLVFQEQGRLDEAATAAGRAMALDPDNTAAAETLERIRAKMATAEEREGRDKTAADLVRAGVEHLESGNTAHATLALREALTLNPTPELESLAQRSRESLRRELLRGPEEPSIETRLREAHGLAASGDNDQSLVILETILSLQPQQEEAQRLRSRLLQEEAEKRREEEHGERIQDHLLVGKTAFEDSRYEDSLSALNRVLALDSSQPEALELLQRVFEALRARILAGGEPVVRLPPEIFLARSDEDEEILRSPAYSLAAVIVDDGPQVQVTCLAEADGSTRQARAVSGPRLLDGNRFGSYYTFRYVQELRVSQGSTGITVVVEDADNLRAETTLTVRYQRPWFRWPWLRVSTILILALALVSAWGIREGRRKKLLRRHFNPFVAGPPIRDEALFVGRQELMERVLQTIHNNSILLYGERRIGKTSFLHQLRRRLLALDDPEFEFFPVYVDLQGTSEERFFRTLADQIHEELSDVLEHTISAESTSYGLRELSRDLRVVLARLRDCSLRRARLVLLVDEVDALSGYDAKIQQQLRSLFMRSFAGDLVGVFAGVAIQRGWDRSTSPWYNFFEEVEIGPLSPEDAEELVQRPIRGVLTLEDGVVELVVQQSRARPYLIQRICVELVSRAHRLGKRAIDRLDLKAVADSLLSNKSSLDDGSDTDPEDKTRRAS